MKDGSTIVNCASVTAYQGYPELLDYATTKGELMCVLERVFNHLLL